MRVPPNPHGSTKSKQRRRGSRAKMTQKKIRDPKLIVVHRKSRHPSACAVAEGACGKHTGSSVNEEGREFGVATDTEAVCVGESETGGE